MQPSTREFVLVEYERIGSEVIANESMGDGRATLYVTLWSGGVAATAAMRGSADLRKLLLPLGIGLGCLALLGLVTLYRLYKRAIQTDRLLDTLTRLRSLLVHEQRVLAALPWERDQPKPRRGAWLRTDSPRRWTRFPLVAGLVQMVVVLNASVAMLLWLLARPGDEDWIWLPGAGALVAQLLVLRDAYGKDADTRREEMNNFFADSSRPAREQIDLSAGAIVTRGTGGDVQLALVVRKRHGGDVGLPKGHPEGGESLEDAVVREVAEEVGVTVSRPDAKQLIETIAYLAGEARRPKTVVFYAIPAGEVIRGPRDDESVAVRWLAPDKAIDELTYPKEKEVVAAWMRRDA